MHPWRCIHYIHTVIIPVHFNFYLILAFEIPPPVTQNLESSVTPVRQVHEEQAHECNESSTEIEPVQVPLTASGATLDQPALPDLSKEEGAYKSESVEDVIKNIIHYCMEHQVNDPVEILRYYQKEMVIGRSLEVSDVSCFDDGQTNFLMVDRKNIIDTAFEEIKSLSNLRITLEVEFYGEVSFYFHFIYAVYIQQPALRLAIWYYFQHTMSMR